MRKKLFLFFFFFSALSLLSFKLIYHLPVKFSDNKIIYINPGLTVDKLGKILQKEKLIKSNTLFKTILNITGQDKKILHGEYLFSEKTSLYSVIKSITSGNYYYRKISIPECSTVDQILNIIGQNTFLSGYIENKPVEGSIFPETYFFLRNEDKNKVLIRMQKKMNKVIGAIWQENNDIIKSKKELIKLASMIEAEALIKKEKYLISSVFYNRLRKKMRLQSDPTILYAKNLNKNIKTRKIFKRDLRSDNPWNTYTRHGLPKTAICNPGFDAIEAAMTPKHSNYLYFVSDGTGGHRFSSDLEQHTLNVKIWREKLRDNNETKK